jgi:hypothetical protein
MSKALFLFFLCVILFAQSQRLEVFRNQIQSSSKVSEFDYNVVKFKCSEIKPDRSFDVVGYTEDGNHKTVINYKESLQEISGKLVRHVEQETFGRFSIF